MRAPDTQPPLTISQSGADDREPTCPLIDGRDVPTRGEMVVARYRFRAQLRVSNERRVACAAWGINPSELDELDALEVAERLHVRLAWLLTGDEPMVFLDQMTGAQQLAEHQGPGSENLPGHVQPSRAGPWERDERGEWRVAARWKEAAG